jgi:hypothetical protein
VAFTADTEQLTVSLSSSQKYTRSTECRLFGNTPALKLTVLAMSMKQMESIEIPMKYPPLS